MQTVPDESLSAEECLDREYTRLNDAALSHQWRRQCLAWGVALSSPIAVTVLAVQHLYVHDRWWGGVLVAAELSVILFALAVEYFGFGASHKQWIHCRLQAEAVRRERFLLGVRVGPYLGVTDALPTVSARLAAFRDPFAHPLQFLSLRAAEGVRWSEALDGTTDAEKTTNAALREQLQGYLAGRVRDQLEYFSSRDPSLHRWDHWTEIAAKGILLATAVVVALKLSTFVAPDAEHALSPWATLWLFGALVMPVFGASIMAVRSLFEPHRLLRSCLTTCQQLREIEPCFHELLARCAGDARAFADPALVRRCKRLVLESEAILTEDFRRWWVIVEPETPRG
jgi:hypothetical protein